LTKFDRLKNLASLTRQLFKNSRIVKFVSGLVRKVRGEKPRDRQFSGSDDPILVRHFDSENLKPIHDQIPKDTSVDAFDSDRNIFDPLPDPEIDFSKESDLEAYTKRLNVPREVIEKWVAAGILQPDEIKVAEKMLKIMRKKDTHRKNQDPNSAHD
jgi:hypothetical protein